MSFRATLVTGIAGLLMFANANAGPREQAKRMHDRIAGVPPSASVLQDMQDEIQLYQFDVQIDHAIENEVDFHLHPVHISSFVYFQQAFQVYQVVYIPNFHLHGQ